MRVQRWQERRAEYLRAKGAREWVVTGRDGRVILRALVIEKREERHGEKRSNANGPSAA
jgi:hypothetical protein